MAMTIHSTISPAVIRRVALRTAVALIFAALTISNPVWAKDEAPALRLKAKYDGKRVILRWAPSDMKTDYAYTLTRVTGGKETPVGTYGKTALKDIGRDVSKDTAKLLTALLYPQSLYTTDDRKLEALSQKDNQTGMAFFLAELKPDVARALGLRAEDMAVSAGKTYTYVLRARDGGKDVAVQRVTVSTAAVAVLSAPNVTARRYDWGCALRWTRYDDFTAFHVYRSTHEHKGFEKITSSPVSVNTVRKDNGQVETPPYFYSDTNTKKERPVYFYKVSGIDSFGDESPLSVPTLAIRDDSLRPPPQLPVTPVINEPYIDLSWETDPAGSAALYHVYRSSRYNGPYERLTQTPIPGRTYTDRNVSYGVNYFYCHSALDREGRESVMSLPRLAVLKDRTPPAVPGQFKAVAEKGAVHLSWLPVQDPDIAGYELYRATSKDAMDWAMLTSKDHRASTFTDSMSALLDKKPYYYKVLAKDRETNRSAFSDIIEITLPDVTAPSAPAWKATTWAGDIPVLGWHPSTSIDMSSYKIYRGRGNTRVLAATLPKTALTWTETQAEPGETVWYVLTAVDTAGNESDLSSALAVKHRDKTPPSLSGLRIEPADNGILISLSTPDKDFSSMTIQRKTGPKAPFKTLVSGHRMPDFLDRFVDPGKTYTYKVRAYDTSGNVAISAEMTGRVKP